MKNNKNHIIIFLLGFFIFPIVFQSVHIVEHHSAKKTNKLSFVTKLYKNIYNNQQISKVETLCPICDYSISVADIENENILIVSIPETNYSYINNYVSQKYETGTFPQPSRASPILFS